MFLLASGTQNENINVISDRWLERSRLTGLALSSGSPPPAGGCGDTVHDTESFSAITLLC